MLNASAVFFTVISPQEDKQENPSAGKAKLHSMCDTPCADERNAGKGVACAAICSVRGKPGSAFRRESGGKKGRVADGTSAATGTRGLIARRTTWEAFHSCAAPDAFGARCVPPLLHLAPCYRCKTEERLIQVKRSGDLPEATAAAAARSCLHCLISIKLPGQAGQLCAAGLAAPAVRLAGFMALESRS